MTKPALIIDRHRPTTVACVACGHPRSDVVDSRPIDDGKHRRRRRVCEKCDCKWTTVELPIEELRTLQRQNASVSHLVQAFIAAGK